MTTPRITRTISRSATRPVTRRRALAGATSVGLTLPLLSACGDDGSGTATDPTESAAPTSDGSSAATSETTTAVPETTVAPETTAPAEGTAGVVATSDVPVGSGVILADEEVVVTQPTEGDIKVFSSTCTHTGCQVTEVTDTIGCPCHGSSFDITSGDVLSGPAPSALPAVDFTVEGDQVVLS